MVNKQHLQETNEGPPPLGESWWEAILAEDEAMSKPFSTRTTTQAGLDARVGQPSPANEPASVDWEKAARLYEEDGTIQLIVTGSNRGGLLVSGEGLQGFVPLSHLVEMPDEKTAADQEQWLEKYVGQPLQLKVIECDQERGRVVFSERAALAEPGRRNLLLEQLKPGDCVMGTVTNITDFGVFVDLGGVEGLVHVSEISWGRVRHPRDVVSLGQQVQVYIIQVDQERARVGLSLKRLCSNPWATAEARYYPGQVTDAVVTSIVSFGAFARLEEGLDGLIHVSEINAADGNAEPGEQLHEGQQVRVRVLHVDGARQRLGLSLRLND
jgi:small subunit ribosomal protein S1